MSKRIVVMGGTGKQGRAVVRAIHKDPAREFSCAVLTRDKNSKQALAMKDKGCELIEADADDVDSLKRAFAGAYGLFAVTNFWEHNSIDKEIQQGKNIVDAAKAAGVQHTVWSTLEPTKDYVTEAKDNSFKPINGWIVPHFDGKGEISKYFRKTNTPFTDLYTSYFMENFLDFGIQRLGERKYGIVMNMENSPLPVVVVSDIGRAALMVLKNRNLYLNKEFYVASESLPVQQFAEKFQQHLGIDIKYVKMPYEKYIAQGFPSAHELGNMFHFKHKYTNIFAGRRDVNKCKELVPGLESADVWITKHKKKILDHLNSLEKEQVRE